MMKTPTIDNYIPQLNSNALSKPKPISKMAIDEKELHTSTLPNPVCTGGIEEIGLTRLNPFDIPKFLLMHPVVPRGIEIKANRMILLVDEDLKRNIFVNEMESPKDIFDKNFKEADLEDLRAQAKLYCKNILYNSGGALFLKQYCQAAYRFGTGFSVLQHNLAENEILKFECQHPIFFGVAKYPLGLTDLGWGKTPPELRKRLRGRMKINDKTKSISHFTQLTKKYTDSSDTNDYSQLGVLGQYLAANKKSKLMNNELISFGEEIHESDVITLLFDRIGDEPLGISLVQYVHLTIKYLLDMERGGAQAMVNFGFNKWKANTPFKNPAKLAQFAGSLANIQKESIICLPPGIDMTNIEPGSTDYPLIHPIYMKLIAIRLGIPLALLEMSGNSTNKATLGKMMEDMHDDFIADELTIELSINGGFFKACKYKWKDFNVKQLELIVPKFKFKQPPANIEHQRNLDLKLTLSIRNMSMAAEMWLGVGNAKLLALISKKTEQIIKNSMDQDFKKEEYTDADEKLALEMISTKQKLIMEQKCNIDKQVEDVDKQTEKIDNEDKD